MLQRLAFLVILVALSSPCASARVTHTTRAVNGISAHIITSDNQLLFVSITSSITLENLAGIMKSLGSVEAMNLDGGASTAM